jgi:alpha-L-fucosidase
MQKLISLSLASLLCLPVLAETKAAPVDTLGVKISEAHEPMATGVFEPTWQSLEDNYKVPDWFRDAKFGIWAHWGPQCVEGTGDWMGRTLYIEGSNEYNYHVEHYGHPSEFGFKDILPLFKAENWNPEKLVAFYKEVGAKYFVALANHHDNFDMWDSKYQEWNAKNIGPKRDVMAEWKAAADKAGLPFGVSIHADHAWTWYETAQRYDQKGGPKMGVPYDGHLTKEDGKGKWWEGYDPQHLYRQNHEMSEGSWAQWQLIGQWDWKNGASIPSEEFATNVYDRSLDLINRFNPDFIYFDVTGLPLWPVSDCGLKIGAHFYNHYMATHNGKLNAVMTGKILTDEQKKGLVWDVERGAPNEMIPLPWQTCTCLGNWHYNQAFYDHDLYKSAATVIKMLVDIVSKNGNMLLSVPLRGDGTFDEKEEAILLDIRDWMKVNGESIYATRPWHIFGEGPVAESTINLDGAGFNEDAYKNASPEEIRFATKGKTLYASALAWPEEGNGLLIKSLAKGSKYYTGKIHSVELLGYGKVKFTRTDEGLKVELPAATNKVIPVLKIK